MKLFLIAQDKANHFIYGFTIFILVNLIFNAYLSLTMVFLFASGKEIYDEWKYGGFNWKDLMITLIPSIILTLKEIL